MIEMDNSCIDYQQSQINNYLISVAEMSDIYVQEPPCNGKVCLSTTVGEIDIELWSKECPKACRNFIQLCMEG